MTSIIYRNIHLYRLVINTLYLGNLKKRYQRIYEILDNDKPRDVLELCFGDIKIANYCRENNIPWKGYDLNETFVNHAMMNGYDAKIVDIDQAESFPDADCIIIQGSLYHFEENIEKLLSKIFSSTNRLIISEPIRNLTDSGGVLGKVASVLTNAGKGEESFRYNKESLVAMVDKYKDQFSFRYNLFDAGRDMAIDIRVEK